ncbi:NUDIX domain-containing protein [Epibacterium sp. SM1969]|uniref:NUDIX domain-containing protein n=1 Tax=Tritonibacter aquimaris TaxID=2663379 RepID=A0A844AV50_9RHOB|nr:NUDIX hydrolase [Tritonibacter aquimaris]MQY41881.1 NUDIX domain-containing protein [Tritonibacter aquimaris]
MIPRFGEPPLSGVKYRARPGAYVILPRNGHLLLTGKMRPIRDLQLPGGGVERGEHMVPALHREVYEETGWAITTPRKIGIFRLFSYLPDYKYFAEKICHIYLAQPLRKLGPPVEPDHEPIWSPIEVAAESLGNPGDRYFVRQLMRRG